MTVPGAGGADNIAADIVASFVRRRDTTRHEWAERNRASGTVMILMITGHDGASHPRFKKDVSVLNIYIFINRKW